MNRNSPDRLRVWRVGLAAALISAAMAGQILLADPRTSEDLYPDLERLDFDATMDQVAGATPIHPMPLVVLSADYRFGPNWQSKIAEGVVPPGTPSDLGYIIDRAQKSAQDGLAALVPNAKHVTNTHSGHNIPMEQPQLVIDAIREVVGDVRGENPQSTP